MDIKVVLKLLGKLSGAFCIVLLVPLAAALIRDRANVGVFAATLAVSLAVTFFFQACSTAKRIGRLRVREAVAVLGCGWLYVCAMGALPYFFSGIVDPVTCVFESVAGFTTTGITTVDSYSRFPDSILVWRCLTHWFGGIGVIMLFITIMPQMTGSTSYLFNTEQSGGMGERTLPRIKESAMMLLFVYGGLIIIELILLLAVGLDPFRSVNLAVATMATGGFSFYHDDLVAFDSVPIEVICIVFMIIASTNFSLFYKLWQADWKKLAKDTECRCYLAVLAVAAAALTADLYCRGTMGTFAEALRYGIFQAVSFGSTTGFASADYCQWSGFSQYILFLLMFVGGCSGSTAGGIKIVRMLILLKAAWSELLHALHPQMVQVVRVGGRAIDSRTVGNVTRFFFLYIFAFIVLSALISLCGFSMMDSMGVIAATMSSVGAAFGALGPTQSYAVLSDFGRIIIIISMLLGRLEIFTLLVLLRSDFWGESRNW